MTKTQAYAKRKALTTYLHAFHSVLPRSEVVALFAAISKLNTLLRTS